MGVPSTPFFEIDPAKGVIFQVYSRRLGKSIRHYRLCVDMATSHHRIAQVLEASDAHID